MDGERDLDLSLSDVLLMYGAATRMRLQKLEEMKAELIASPGLLRRPRLSDQHHASFHSARP